MSEYTEQASDVFFQVSEKPAGDRVLIRIALAITLACLVLFSGGDAFAKAKKGGTAPNQKYASIVVDAASGAIISESNSNKSLHPASLTKVMTLLLLFEALESGNVRLSDKIYISNHAAAQQPSKLGLAAGSSIRVEDAILAIVTKSANDISAAVAEHIAGSESRFALRMTRRARDIGMSRTTFKNAHGLHNPGQITTARDMATLARYVIVRYPNYYRYFSTKQFTYRGKTYTNHNRLMNTYPGMDGFKTGFINASGFNLIASARKDGQRLIGVVFGGKTWKSRNDHMAQLLNTGFSKMPDMRYAQKQQTPQEAVPVVALAAPPKNPAPVPPAKPVFKTTTATAIQPGVQAPSSFTSLSALTKERPPQTLQLPQDYKNDTTERAVAAAQYAINSGEYSEVTGEGDYDAAIARRVETGLMAAAVYKGEHEKVKQMQMASALQAAGQIDAPARSNAIQPVALPPSPPPSDLWSVQIGAYTSRVIADDSLRRAHAMLPADLSHALPIVVPLTTGEGTLFRGRLGNLSKDQAMAACRQFRDCLTVAPR